MRESAFMKKPHVYRHRDGFFRVYVPCNMTLFGLNCAWAWKDAVRFAVGPHICPKGKETVQ